MRAQKAGCLLCERACGTDERGNQRSSEVIRGIGAGLTDPFGEGLEGGPELDRIVVLRAPPERLEHLLLNQRHGHQLGQPHHERGDEEVACALGTGDEDELPLAIAERLAVVGGLLGLHVRPPEGRVERRLDGRAPLHDLDEGLLLRTSLRMWRAMEPELDWKRSGMVPRMRRPQKMRLNTPTPMPFRRYTRRAMAAARM